MKNLIYIFLLAGILGYAQETPPALEDVNKDDLGNVTDTFQELFFDALKEKGIENYEKAIMALEKCRELEPKSPVVYFELGNNYMELENFNIAQANFSKALELDPDNKDVLMQLYNVYGITEQYDKAVGILKKLIAADPIYKDELPELYIITEQYDLALRTLDELDSKYGNSGYRNSLRRKIYSKTNNTEAQISNLEDGISSNPENEQNYLNLIYIHSEQGNDEEAFRIAQELLETHPGSTIAHLALYKFYLEKGNTEEAVNSMKVVFDSEEIDGESKFKVLNDFLNFVQKNPKYEPQLIEVTQKLSEAENAENLYEKMGDFYLKKGNKADALQFFMLGLEKDPANFQLLRNTLLLQVDADEYLKAQMLSEKAIEIFPSQAFLYLIQGVSLNRLGEYAKAEEVLTEGLDYLFDDKVMEKDFYKQLAMAYSGIGDEVNAEKFQQMAEDIKI